MQKDKKAFKAKKPGKDVFNAVVETNNADGSYNVKLAGYNTFLRNVPNISDKTFSKGSVVRVGFYDAGKQCPFLWGYSGDVRTAFVSETVPDNPYPWQCRGRDCYNSNRSDYPFSYVAGTGTEWTYNLLSPATNLCIALVNDTDYILVGARDRALCIDENSNLIWETAYTSPGLSGIVYAYHGFIMNDIFYGVRGWLDTPNKRISISLDLFNIEDGTFLEQKKYIWQLTDTVLFSATGFYIRPSDNGTSYFVPLSASLPLTSDFSSAIFTQNGAIPDTSSTYLNMDDDFFLNINDRNYATGTDKNTVYVLSEITYKLIMTDQNGILRDTYNFDEFYSKVITGYPPIPTPSVPAVVTTTTSRITETITKIKGYRNKSNGMSRIFVFTDHQESCTILNEYYYSIAPSTPYIKSIIRTIYNFERRIYIFDYDLNIINIISSKYRITDTTKITYNDGSYSETGDDKFLSSLSYFHGVINNREDYLLHCTFGTDQVYYNENGTKFNLNSTVLFSSTDFIYDSTGAFIEYGIPLSRYYDNAGNLLYTKTSGGNDMVAGKHGVYGLFWTTGEIIKY